MRWLLRFPAARRARACALEAGVAVSITASIAIAPLAAAQTATSSAAAQHWHGWARCDVDVTGPGYDDRQSHLWILAASPPTTQAAMRIHAATWSVTGAGSLQRAQGTQSLDAQWTTDVPGISAPIAFIVRASDGRLLVRPWHAQLRAGGAVGGTQQVTMQGRPQAPSAFGREAFEWTFPAIEDSVNAVLLAGSSTSPTTGSVGLMQPAGASGTASCSWHLSRGATAVARSAQTAATSTVSSNPAAAGSLPISTAGGGSVSLATPRSAAGVVATTGGGAPIASPPQTTGGRRTRTFPSALPAQAVCPANSLATPSSRAGVTVGPLGSASASPTRTTPAPARGGALTNPTSPCPGISQRLSDLAASGDAALQQIVASATATGSASGSSAAECAQQAADMDAALSALLQSMQVEYAKLLREVGSRVCPVGDGHCEDTNRADLDAISKSAAGDLAMLRKARDRILAQLLTTCRT